ncbi:tetratricopeptide (TPR) repeat protein/predicted alpha/beta hydrolase family esterase [Catenulispora sp. EB89]|uniref:alpha/beta hydrolase n=1 Tax=Catenulispora sp. EB89 TaxID=3156257 RepID=UPI0035178CD8
MPSRVHVLFVHGLFSGADTWSHFLGLLSSDPDLAFVQTHTMQYFTPKARLRPDRRIPDFADLAAQLATRLKAEDLREAGSIVLVAHSQGGLVVQKFLASATIRGQARDLVRIRQIVLYACPTLGSPFFAKTRRLVFGARHPQERQLRLLDGEVFEAHQLVLRNVVNADAVTDYTCPIPVVAVVGGEDNIVPRIEATGWFPTTETVAADHFSILKPADHSAMEYQILKPALLAAADPERQRSGPAVGTGADAVEQQAIQFSVEPPAGLGRLRGRDALISALMAPGRSRVHVLSGMSGIGKTHIASEVAARRKEEGWNVWWVSVPQLAPRMREVAHLLGLPRGEIDEAWRGERSQTDLVWRGLEHHDRPWLLVFDGATDPQQLGHVASDTGRYDGTGWVRDVTSAKGSVIVTARGGHNDVWGPWCRIHQVEPLSEYDGADVLLDIAGPDCGGVEQARQLSRALGGLPLALRAAASRVRSVSTGAVFLSEPGLSDFAGYLAEWRTREQAGNGDPAAESGQEVLGLSIVRESLLLSARGLTTAATRLLHLFACLSDTAVPYRLLARPEMLTETPLFAGVPIEQIRLAIGQLAEAYLIRKHERGAEDPDLSEFLSLHPMVHNVFREDDQVQAHRVDYGRAMLDILAAATENRTADDPDNWAVWAALFPHARDAVLSTVTSPATSGERFLVVSALNLARTTARYLLASGLLEPAGTLLDALIDGCAGYRFAPTDTKILALRHERARLSIELGRYDHAEAELAEVIAGQIAGHGPDHANTWASRHQLAKALLEQQRWVEAEAMLREILPAARRINGWRHRDTVTVWHTWARALLHVEGARQAETMCREILAACDQLWTPSYPETLYAWQTLGRSLLYQQKPDLAEWELRRGLSRVADTASPGALGIRHFLGMAVLQQGLVAEARDELSTLLVDEERVLGPRHRLTDKTRRLIAEIGDRLRGGG